MAAHEVILGDGMFAHLFHSRNAAMVRDSNLLIAVSDPSVNTGGTATTVANAKAQGKSMVHVTVATRRTLEIGG